MIERAVVAELRAFAPRLLGDDAGRRASFATKRGAVYSPSTWPRASERELAAVAR